MIDTTAQGPSVAAGATTAHIDFYNATPNGDKLFSVRGGIPLGDAFDQLALLLSASKSAVDEVCATVSQDAEPQSHWAASHMLEFCYALSQSLHQGFLQHERASDTRQNLTP